MTLLQTKTNPKGAIFVVANFPYTADLDSPQMQEFVKRKFERDFPWLLTDGHEVLLSGVGRGWHGRRNWGTITAHASVKATGRLPLDAVMAWITHLVDAWKTARRGLVIGVAPTPDAGLGLALARLILGRKLKLVVRVQGNTSSRSSFVHKKRWRSWVLEQIQTFALRRADLVVPMGDFTKQLAIGRGVDPSKVIVLPFPVRWADRAYVAPLAPIPTVLFVGRLEKEKGIHILLDAMQVVIKTIPQARLLIAGDGSYRQALEEKADLLGLRHSVSFLGWLEGDDLIRAYQEAWVLVLPSILEEGLGMVLVEAGLMGRPVVGSDLGGIRDIIRHGYNGFLVPPGNTWALADALAPLLKDRELARRMGLANREVALEYLRNRDEAVERVRQAIYALMDGKR